MKISVLKYLSFVDISEECSLIYWSTKRYSLLTIVVLPWGIYVFVLRPFGSLCLIFVSVSKRHPQLCLYVSSLELTCINRVTVPFLAL